LFLLSFLFALAFSARWRWRLFKQPFPQWNETYFLTQTNLKSLRSQRKHLTNRQGSAAGNESRGFQCNPGF